MVENINRDRLVSIALATYNGEKFLREQLDSIVNQSYTNMELVVVDDCSTDGTIDILEQYFSKINIKLYRHKKNSGFVKAFEKALGMCSGLYIALCDQDDIWEKNKIEQLVNVINGYSLVYSDASLIDSYGTIFIESMHKYYEISKRSDIGFKDLVFNNYIVGCCSLFKRDLLNDALPFPPDLMVHDWWIALIASKKGRIKYYDKPLLRYRQHANNLIGIGKSNGILKNIVWFLKKDKVKCNKYKVRHILLKCIINHKIIQQDDQHFIKSAMEYYESYYVSKKLVRHFILTLKHFKHLYIKRRIYFYTKERLHILFHKLGNSIRLE
ncbi:MAG TPA: glycosyltransferase family 2 protein [Desulfobacteraceae bacterium]|nr:glycosyltransferase family 2 protein [Desulfobacteraceae bacterium]HPJ66363.1 glycosyltransferase family 2 protein [Desulfobacteraceae bacterium]HPQ27207.1 glycosyltransferase family 2 protein [Desulfobacteraceae bacterium]